MKKNFALWVCSAFAVTILTGCIDGFRPSGLLPFKTYSTTTNTNTPKPGDTFVEPAKQ